MRERTEKTCLSTRTRIGPSLISLQRSPLSSLSRGTSGMQGNCQSASRGRNNSFRNHGGYHQHGQEESGISVRIITEASTQGASSDRVGCLTNSCGLLFQILYCCSNAPSSRHSEIDHPLFIIDYRTRPPRDGLADSGLASPILLHTALRRICTWVPNDQGDSASRCGQLAQKDIMGEIRSRRITWRLPAR